MAVNSSECIRYDGTHDSDGYGVRNVWRGKTRKLVKAHRLAREAVYGAIPDGLCILHSCDVRDCINIEHLRVGTHGDNSRDRVARNRQAKGALNGRALLSEADVREIRKLSWLFTQAFWARKHNVWPTAIAKIIKNHNWRCVK